jgi:hypothetical protein
LIVILVVHLSFEFVRGKMGDYDDDEAPKRQPLELRPYETGVLHKIIDRCGPKARKFWPEELAKLKYKSRVPLKTADDEVDAGREEAGGGKKKKSSARGALMIGDTSFKRWNVGESGHVPEKEDEWDISVLKSIHFNMTYADTYAELSASKIWVVEHYDRGFSLFYILVYVIACGLLIQRLDKIREGEIKFGWNDGYQMVFNGLWWNSLWIYAYLMVIQCFGVLSKFLALIQHRLYFAMFSLAIPAMTAAYLWKEACGSVSPWLMYITFALWCLSVGRPAIHNRLANPLADDLFFFCFLALVVQAICSKDNDFLLHGILPILAAFAYAGPLGDWGPFPLRIAFWVAGIYHSIPQVMQILGSRTGPLTPQKWLNEVKGHGSHAIFKIYENLPLSNSPCKLKFCEPGLFALFAGGAFGFGDDAFAEKEEAGSKEKLWAVLLDFGLDIDLSFSAEDVLFWVIVLSTTALAWYVLNHLENLNAQHEDKCVPEPLPYIRPLKMYPCGVCPSDVPQGPRGDEQLTFTQLECRPTCPETDQ